LAHRRTLSTLDLGGQVEDALEMGTDDGVALTSERPGARRVSTRMEQLFNVTVFALFFALWALFAYALVANQGGLDSVWQWLRGQHIVVQGVVWLLFLPVTFGLWAWETGWPLLVRLVLVVAVAGWNIWMFFPKSLLAR
jgi:hypothetical protein